MGILIGVILAIGMGLSVANTQTLNSNDKTVSSDSTPDGILNLDNDLWHNVYKRDAIDDEEEKEMIMDKIRNAPMKIRTEINKDVKILAPRTYFSIPLWKELVNVGKDWLSNDADNHEERTEVIMDKVKAAPNTIDAEIINDVPILSSKSNFLSQPAIQHDMLANEIACEKTVIGLKTDIKNLLEQFEELKGGITRSIAENKETLEAMDEQMKENNAYYRKKLKTIINSLGNL